MKWLSLLVLPLLGALQTNPSDDQAVMTAFSNNYTAKKDESASKEWLYILYPKWTTSDRIDFDRCLAAEIENSKNLRKEVDMAKPLEVIKGQIADLRPTYIAPALVPLSSIEFTSNMILTAFRGPWKHGRSTARNAEGKELPVACVMSVKPPGYSRDGQFSCVEMRFPNGHHMSRDRFFIGKVDGRWTILAICRTNFV